MDGVKGYAGSAEQWFTDPRMLLQSLFGLFLRNLINHGNLDAKCSDLIRRHNFVWELTRSSSHLLAEVLVALSPSSSAVGSLRYRW